MILRTTACKDIPRVLSIFFRRCGTKDARSHVYVSASWLFVVEKQISSLSETNAQFPIEYFFFEDACSSAFSFVRGLVPFLICSLKSAI
jgi:hypothetical protein